MHVKFRHAAYWILYSGLYRPIDVPPDEIKVLLRPRGVLLCSLVKTFQIVHDLWKAEVKMLDGKCPDRAGEG